MKPAGSRLAGLLRALRALALALSLAGAPAAAPAPAAGAPGTTGARPAPAATAPSTPATGLAAFAGTWRLDVPASDFGRRGRVPRSREEIIRHEGAWLSVRSLTVRGDGDTLLLEYRYRSDGDATNLMRGQEIRTRGRRDGAAVRFASEATFLLVKLQVDERWSVSADGATLTEERTSRSPLGDERQKLVFRRLP
jgi:hypothetical protein